MVQILWNNKPLSASVNTDKEQACVCQLKPLGWEEMILSFQELNEFSKAPAINCKKVL